jgi:hypothetical protein
VSLRSHPGGRKPRSASQDALTVDAKCPDPTVKPKSAFVARLREDNGRTSLGHAVGCAETILSGLEIGGC